MKNKMNIGNEVKKEKEDSGGIITEEQREKRMMMVSAGIVLLFPAMLVIAFFKGQLSEIRKLFENSLDFFKHPSEIISFIVLVGLSYFTVKNIINSNR